MKKIITLLVISFILTSAQAQFATYTYMCFDKNDKVNFYKLELNSMRGEVFWATLIASGDTENYTLSCDVEYVEGLYIVKYKGWDESNKGSYWQDELMDMIWENEDQPVLFTVEIKEGEIATVFKRFKVQNAEMPIGETLDGFTTQ